MCKVYQSKRPVIAIGGAVSIACNAAPLMPDLLDRKISHAKCNNGYAFHRALCVRFSRITSKLLYIDQVSLIAAGDSRQRQASGERIANSTRCVINIAQ